MLPMKTVLSVVCLTSFVLQTFAGNADEPFECAWRRLFEKFRSPKTGLLYEHLPDEMPGAVERYLPTPDEVARNEPIATGWNTGMEDGVLNGCPLILAAMARKDKRAVELLVPGVLRCATISSVPGFLARSILPADGRSHYVNSSRDQYTLFVYTMWRYANSDFCSPGRRAEIVRIVTDIARFTRRCVRKEHGYDILREDGKQGIVCTMWMDNPWGPLVTNAVGRVGRGNVLAHEVGRLPMIYAAAYALTGDKAWRECELEVADAALRIQEFDPLKSYQGFMFLQMQVSQRLLWECESDPGRRARYLKMLRRIARASRAGMDCAEGLFAELGGDLSAPAGDWRHWKRELVMGGDGMYNGLPYRMPIRPDAYQKAYRCVVELGDAVIVPLLCPDCQLEPDYLERFLRLSRKADFAHVMSPGLVYPVLAREMIRERADAARSVAAAGGPSGERLYNGIELPRDWPPREFSSLTRETQRVPYLEERPDVVPIDVGRQLFVDDFLIETTSLRREWHYPEKYEGNPVLRPETPLEINRPSNSTARVSSGGVWWDPKRKKYRMWYEAGFCSAAAYAESDDGLHWRRVDLDVVPGTNRLFPEGTMRFDTWVVTPDFAAEDPYANWRLFVRPPGPDAMCAFVAESPDGLHWSEFREVGLCGDASLCCYNPFRRKWVFSLRNELGPWGLGGSRVRSYREASDFLAGANGSFRLGESTEDTVLWLQPDLQEPRDPGLKLQPQLYSVPVVAYESLMIGGFAVWKGPENDEIVKCGRPKIIDVCFAFSRDGFHFSRLDRTPAIASERWASGRWDAGYVLAMPNLFVVEDERLLFYYGACSGNSKRLGVGGFCCDLNGCYDQGASGVAILRRDGFVSLRPNVGRKDGEIVTRPLTFSGRYLFVNADMGKGNLRAEVLDAAGCPIRGFSAAESSVVTGDRVKARIDWKNGQDLGSVANRTVRFRFLIKAEAVDAGDLYAFWVSSSPNGESGGYLGGGGRAYQGVRDTNAKMRRN